MYLIMSLSKVHCFFTSSPRFFFSLVFQMLISGLCGTNVRKTRTSEAPELLGPGESAKPTSAVGSANLAKVVAESSKLTP